MPQYPGSNVEILVAAEIEQKLTGESIGSLTFLNLLQLGFEQLESR